MASKKKKFQALVEKFSAENAAHLSQTLQELQQDLTKTEQIKDTGERYEALEAIEGKISAFETETKAKLEKQVGELTKFASPTKLTQWMNGISGTVFLGGLVGGLVGGLAVATEAVLASAAFSTLFFPWFLTTVVAEVTYLTNLKRPARDKKAAANAARPALDPDNSPLQTLNDTIRQKKEAILNDLPTLVESSKFDDLCARIPSLNQAFLKAAKDATKASLTGGPIRIHKPAPKQSKDA